MKYEAIVPPVCYYTDAGRLHGRGYAAQCRWCEENVGAQWDCWNFVWTPTCGVFSFEHEEDMIWFLLKWA